MKVKILGTGCSKCKTLEKKLYELIERHNISCKVEKVTELNQILDYGIMMTPGLVIDEKVVSVGKVPGEKELLNWLQG